ncbi:hypothetical protein C8A03DRAFT_40474 [Achaetomium macrosporum]|uniref:Rhodopsin domain-containing protein n=1 Tax=Achaetomium macrosporum TaxID=79813 RepID=A0AAN7CIE5_9PEZI|nr:hypothetical protein C8A03DRAFT_40474 [Achaetomium macrosporum]
MAADFTADLSRGPVLLSFSLATASFAFATTFVRFYTRKRIDGGFGADDYTSGAATVIALIGTIFGILESTSSDPARALQFNVLGQPWYLISVTLSKISICLFFMDLLRRARQWRLLLAGLIVAMAVINLVFALAVYLQCWPLEKLWNPDVAGDCSGPGIQMSLGYAQGALSVFSWVFFALFQVLIVRDVSRGGKPKWPFYVTSALSLVCGIFVIVRTAQISQTAGISIYIIQFFYASAMANLEQNLSLISSNLLTLGPLFSPSSSLTTTTTTTRTTSTTTSSPSHRSKNSRRDPYSSASSASTSRSHRSGKSTSTKPTVLSPPNRPGSSTSTRSIVRPDTDSSRESSRHDDHHHSDPAGYDGLAQRHGQREGEGYGYGHGDGDRGGSDHINLGAWWPRGIIKTVEVEVVEEVNEEYVAAVAGGGGGGGMNGVGVGVGAGRSAGSSSIMRGSGASAVAQDWESILRAGPPR